MTEISRRQFVVYLVAVVLVVLLGGRALRADPNAGAAPAPAAFTPGGEPGTGSGKPDGGAGATGPGAVEVAQDGAGVLVHVAGRVRRPGVYELAEGARIGDAVRKAGGGRPGADLDGLNLAAKLADGQQVLVARRGGPVGVAAAAAAADGGVAGPAGGPGATTTVNVNQADAVQLEGLTGVGPAIAAKIVDYRTQNGPFKTVDDLAQVSGIGEKTLEGMRAQVAL